MTLSQWLFGNVDNPAIAGQWGSLHIAVMILCASLILTFDTAAKRSKNPERTKRIIICALLCCSAFFEIMLRFTRYINLLYIRGETLTLVSALEIALPRPWCQISTWLMVSSIFVRKQYYYNLACLSAFLSALVFFVYPSVGFNNEYLLFENWYSICTHSLLMTTSITMMCFKYADFRYKWFGKVMIGIGLIFVYALLQIFVLTIHADPLYFMPGGEIQADILKINYGLYLPLYFLVIFVYLNVPHILGDRETVRSFFTEKKYKKLLHREKAGV